MKNNVLNFSENTQKYIFWSTCFILLLPVILLPPSFQPSDWTRSILLKIALIFLFSLILFKFFYKKEFSIEIPSFRNPVYFPITALLGFLAVVTTSTIFSVDRHFSFFGSPVRSGGLLNILFLFLFSLFLATFIKNENYWHRFIKINFISGVVVSLIGFVQYFGFLKSIFIVWEAGGPPSIVGNSTFLAIYMIFLTFSSFYYFLNVETNRQRILYLCLSILFLLTIIISGSRATYIGILIAFAFYFFFLPTKYISFHKEQFKWLDLEKFKLLKIVTVLVIVLGLIGVIYVNLNPVLPKFIEGNPKISHFVKNRLSIPIVLRDITGARFSAWKITWQSIKEKPLLGWGPENSYIGFEKYYDPTLPPGLQKLWWDRPHNIFLQIWSESGIIALVLYIGFWATLFWRLQKLKKQNPDKKAVFASHGLQAMVIAYLVVLFFQFDGFTTYLISFFFIGYSFFLISSYQKTETIIFYPPIKITTFKKILIALFFLLMILFIWFWNIGPLYFNEKLSHIESINCVKKMDYIDDINPEKFGIIKSFGALKYSDFVKQCISVKPQKELEYSTKSLNYLKEALKIQPYFSRTLLFMGSFTNVIAAREKSPEIKNNLIIEARSYLEKGMELSPKRQEFLIEMEKNHLIATDYEMMKKVANDCILIDDANGACYWYLGIAQIFLGDQINGRKSIALSQEKGYLGPNIAYKQLAVAYMSQNNWQEALLAYKIVTPPSSELFPSEAASYHATLAYLYSKAGNYVEASKEALEVFKIQPDNQETIQFLATLLNLEPNSIELHKNLAYVYKKTGDNTKYQKELLFIENGYNSLIFRYPNDSTQRFNLAYSYKQLEENEKATYELIKISKLFPDQRPKAEEVVKSMGGHLWSIYVIEMSK